MTNPVTAPDGDILALYNGGNWKAFMTSAFSARLLHAQATGYMVHAGPRGILGTDPDHPDPHDPTALISWLRKVHADGGLPEPTIHFGLGLDGWTKFLGQALLPLGADRIPRATPEAEATVVKMFEQIGAMAITLKVCEIMGDSEDAAIAQPAAGKIMARLFLETFKRVCPGVMLTMTTYDDPVPVEWPKGSGHHWGGVSYHLPYSAWFGTMDLAALLAKQTYVAGKSGLATIAMLFWRRDRSAESIAAAVALGWIDPQLPVVWYLQVHHTSRYAIVSTAANAKRVYFWAAGTPGSDETWDAEGENALAILADLRHRGYRGDGAVDRFLTDTGTKNGPDDHSFGVHAEAALAKMPKVA